MEAYEATRVVFSRIQELDPENATKIMGLLLIQDHGDKEMIRFAFGPDSLLLSLVLKARKELGLLPSSTSPFLHRQNSSPSSWAPNSPFYGGDLVDDHISFLNDPNWGANGHHRRSCSTADLYLGSDASGLWWRSCQRLGGASPLMASVFPNSPTGAMQHSPSSPSTKCINFLLQHQHQQQQQQQQQQQNESQRAVAALMLGGDEARYFIGRRSWMERGELAGMVNPGSRQIYLTFPADSTFREEDASNYFSIYGPVQDVRIPYQQKRMFGFVTFVYPETVKLILAKGNPHFVCDARVLVKPYKEKGRIPDKYKQQLHQQQQAERVDFSGFSTTTGLDSRDPYELQQLGAKLLLRRKLEEKQHELELQQAIELQGRRFAGLQLDLNARSLSFPTTTAEQSPSPEDQSSSPPTADSSVWGTETRSYFQESVEHNLPDSPFASPTRASFGLAESFTRAMSTAEADLVAASPQINSNGSKNHPMAAASTSTLNMASFNSFFLQMPRLSSGHGAVGM